jgi:hypothetical protein
MLYGVTTVGRTHTRKPNAVGVKKMKRERTRAIKNGCGTKAAI